jgi:beta-mannan synthase
MDLAVRASLKGWKFVYVGDLKVSFSVLMTFIKNITNEKSTKF